MKEGDTYVNEHGGRQAYVSSRIDLIPPDHLILLGQCLGRGAKKYGENNWHQIPERENLNHALVHILKWMSGDRTEPHLVNVLARVHFALWHAIQDGEQPLEYIHPEDQTEIGQAIEEARRCFNTEIQEEEHPFNQEV